jgi:hypothetical protein
MHSLQKFLEGTDILRYKSLNSWTLSIRMWNRIAQPRTVLVRLTVEYRSSCQGYRILDFQIRQGNNSLLYTGAFHYHPISQCLVNNILPQRDYMLLLAQLC